MNKMTQVRSRIATVRSKWDATAALRDTAKVLWKHRSEISEVSVTRRDRRMVTTAEWWREDGKVRTSTLVAPVESLVREMEDLLVLEGGAGASGPIAGRGHPHVIVTEPTETNPTIGYNEQGLPVFAGVWPPQPANEPSDEEKAMAYVNEPHQERVVAVLREDLVAVPAPE